MLLKLRVISPDMAIPYTPVIKISNISCCVIPPIAITGTSVFNSSKMAWHPFSPKTGLKLAFVLVYLNGPRPM